MLLPVDPLLVVRLRGVRLTVRVTTLAVLAFVVGGVTNAGIGGDGRIVWIIAVAVTWTALLAVMLARAAVHLWICRRLRVDARRVDLSLFGATVDAADVAGAPRAEALIGAAGLVSLLALAAVFGLLDWLTGDAAAAIHTPIRTLFIACAGLATLQAMPGVPLDGGRLLRAWIWSVTEEPKSGNRVTALYAQVIALGLIVLGGALLPRGGGQPFWGLWLFLGGWLLSGAARRTLRQADWQRRARLVTLRETVAAGGRRVAAAALIDDALDLLIEAGPDAPALVLDGGGRPVGVLGLANLRRVRRVEWDRRAVADVMTPVAGLCRLPGDLSVYDALALLDGGSDRLALVEDEGTLLGAITGDGLRRRLAERNRTSTPTA